MTPLIRKFLLSFGLLGASLLPTEAVPPSADAVLREMSTTLSTAQTFSFSATRGLDVALLGGIEVAGKRANVDVLVQRPDRLSIRATSQAGLRRFVVDGRSLTIYESKPNCYSVTPVPGTLDALVDELDEKYGFVPPLADYAVSNPYLDLRRQADTVTYLGREMVDAGFLGLGGTLCDRVALTGKEADAVLWIAVDDHLPRRLVATFKNLPSKPQLRIGFRRWNLAAKATAADFTFTPPKGAMKIEMWTESKMQRALGAR